MTNPFAKATRKKTKLRLGLTGPAGAGKSHAALKLAKGLGGKIAAIDTENGSLSGYQNLADFDVVNMQAPYTPERMIELIKMAESNGYDVLIIDSITHEWSGPGGCLEMNDRIANAQFKGNTWSAWSVTKPRHRMLIDTIIASPMHIIVTLRSKTETVQEGRKVIKLGMKAEQQDGFEYEMSVVLDIVHEGHYAVASKDRTGLFTDKSPEVITEETGKRLLGWLNSGAEPEQPKPAPPQQPTAPPISAFAKAQNAINAAKTTAQIDNLAALIQQRHTEGALTADETLDLMQLAESMKADLHLASAAAPI